MADENMNTEEMQQDPETKAGTDETELETETVDSAAEDEAEETAETTEETTEEILESETSQDSQENPEETEEEQSQGTGWGRKKKKEKKDKKDEKIQELTDRLQRTMAEFDNFRKRTEKEKSSMYIIGAKEVVEKILPVLDNFERGLSATTEEQKADPFVDGMDKVYKQLLKTLEDLGVEPIEAVGKEFDPNFHNAVMHVEDEEAGDNIVVEEFQKGYMYKDFVVRHSMVKVAN